MLFNLHNLFLRVVFQKQGIDLDLIIWVLSSLHFIVFNHSLSLNFISSFNFLNLHMSQFQNFRNSGLQVFNNSWILCNLLLLSLFETFGLSIDWLIVFKNELNLHSISQVTVLFWNPFFQKTHRLLKLDRFVLIRKMYLYLLIWTWKKLF